jgi:hypothetical protein
MSVGLHPAPERWDARQEGWGRQEPQPANLSRFARTVPARAGRSATGPSSARGVVPRQAIERDRQMPRPTPINGADRLGIARGAWALDLLLPVQKAEDLSQNPLKRPRMAASDGMH